jgi:hypothetical protein
MSTVLKSESISSPTKPPSPQPTLSGLWTQAVKEYTETVGLSKQEEQLLKHPYSAEHFLQLTKDGWDETIIKGQSRHYETIRTAVCHVLGVFDVISPALGLAEVILIRSHHAHGCFRHSHPLALFPALSKCFFRYSVSGMNSCAKW